MSLRLISQYLGHASLETTLLYTHLTPLNVAATLGLPALLGLAFAVFALWCARARPTDLATWGMLAGLGLDDGRAALVVLAGIGLAGGEQFLRALGHERFVLTMRGDDDAEFLRAARDGRRREVSVQECESPLLDAGITRGDRGDGLALE